MTPVFHFAPRWLLAALCAVALPAPVSAEEISFDRGQRYLEQCIAQSPTPAEAAGCIGRGAAHCISYFGWSTYSEAGCLSLEAEYWETRIGTYGYPAEDGPAADAAFEAWVDYVTAECWLARTRFGDGTGASTEAANCALSMHGARATSLSAQHPEILPAQARQSDHQRPEWCLNDGLTATEATICDTAALSELDLLMSSTYALVSDITPLGASQLVWLAARDGCDDTAGCIEARYVQRIDALAANLPTEGRLVNMVNGDIACYLAFDEIAGGPRDLMGDFDLCMSEDLVGRRVGLSFEVGTVYAASCEGNPDCPDRAFEWLVGAMSPLD